MAGWIALACIAGGFVCFFAASESYYNDDEWMAGGIILFIVAIVCGVIWLVSDAKPSSTSSLPASPTEYSDAHWAKVNYDKFVAKYKLTAEQFPRINSESKAQVQARIRKFIEEHPGLKPGQGLPGTSFNVVAQPVVEEKLPEQEFQSTSLNLDEESETGLKFKSDW